MKSIGAYDLEAELGSGGMGTVYRAKGPEGRVAVKVVHPHLVAADGVVERFRREGEIGRSLDHRNVVRTLRADAIDGHQVLVMEYVEGRTLRELLDEVGRVPEELCRHIARGVADALGAIHAAGAIHRDLKPENVMITGAHEIKVMDFGVARLVDAALRLSTTGHFVGSALYAAPEQFQGGAVDERADFYALGLVLYELATGRHPSHGRDLATILRRRLDATPRPASEVNPQLSPFFDELVSGLLEQDRERRLTFVPGGEESTWWRRRDAEIRARTTGPLRRMRIARETALYGREAELAQLGSLFERARAGDAQVVIVDGEAGIGKTRLVDEFVGGLRDVHFVLGSYPPGGAATAAGAFAGAFHEHLGEAGSGAYLTESPGLVPAFDAFLRGEPVPTGHEPLTQDALQTAVVRITRALAAERPTIVLIDDLHFAPAEGRALFAALAQAVDGHRVMVIGTARPTLPTDWLAAMKITRVSLSRLTPKDLADLLVDAFHSQKLADELGWRIATKSDGNPYFAFEIVRGLRDGRLIAQREDGSWHTSGAIEKIEIPSSVRELIHARVVELPDDDKNLLDAASCCGFEFDPTLLAAALEIDTLLLLQRLARVERKHRLVRSLGRRFQFDHHQVQEALYEDMPDPLREAYHAAFAAALEQRGADEGSQALALCEHAIKGARADLVPGRIRPALTHLARTGRHEHACALCRGALDADGVFEGRARIELELALARELHTLGRREEERPLLDRVLAFADASEDPRLRADALHADGAYLLRTGHTDDAVARLDAAVDLARELGDRSLELKALGALGVVHFVAGRGSRAIALHEQALALAKELGNRAEEARAHDNLGAALFSIGRPEDALPHHAIALGIARESGRRAMEANMLGNQGVALAVTGRTDEAHACFEKQMMLAKEVGHRRGEAMAAANLGHIAYERAEIEQCLCCYERQLEIARDVADGHLETQALGNLGRAYQYVGRIEDARRCFESAVARAQEVGEPRGEGFALHSLAEMTEALGDHDRGARLYEEAIALRRRIKHDDGLARSLIAFGRLALARGDADEAIRLLDEGIALADAAAAHGMVPLGAAYRALAAGTGGDDARAAVDATPEMRPSEELEARYILWRISDDASQLARAHELLQVIRDRAPASARDAITQGIPVFKAIQDAWDDRR